MESSHGSNSSKNETEDLLDESSIVVFNSFYECLKESLKNNEEIAEIRIQQTLQAALEIKSEKAKSKAVSNVLANFFTPQDAKNKVVELKEKGSLTENEFTLCDEICDELIYTKQILDLVIDAKNNEKNNEKIDAAYALCKQIKYYDIEGGNSDSRNMLFAKFIFMITSTKKEIKQDLHKWMGKFQKDGYLQLDKFLFASCACAISIPDSFEQFIKIFKIIEKEFKKEHPLEEIPPNKLVNIYRFFKNENRLIEARKIVKIIEASTPLIFKKIKKMMEEGKKRKTESNYLDALFLATGLVDEKTKNKMFATIFLDFAENNSNEKLVNLLQNFVKQESISQCLDEDLFVQEIIAQKEGNIRNAGRILTYINDQSSWVLNKKTSYQLHKFFKESGFNKEIEMKLNQSETQSINPSLSGAAVQKKSNEKEKSIDEKEKPIKESEIDRKLKEKFSKQQTSFANNFTALKDKLKPFPEDEIKFIFINDNNDIDFDEMQRLVSLIPNLAIIEDQIKLLQIKNLILTDKLSNLKKYQKEKVALFEKNKKMLKDLALEDTSFGEYKDITLYTLSQLTVHQDKLIKLKAEAESQTKVDETNVSEEQQTAMPDDSNTKEHHRKPRYKKKKSKQVKAKQIEIYDDDEEESDVKEIKQPQDEISQSDSVSNQEESSQTTTNLIEPSAISSSNKDNELPILNRRQRKKAKGDRKPKIKQDKTENETTPEVLENKLKVTEENKQVSIEKNEVSEPIPNQKEEETEQPISSEKEEIEEAIDVNKNENKINENDNNNKPFAPITQITVSGYVSHLFNYVNPLAESTNMFLSGYAAFEQIWADEQFKDWPRGDKIEGGDWDFIAKFKSDFDDSDFFTNEHVENFYTINQKLSSTPLDVYKIDSEKEGYFILQNQSRDFRCCELAMGPDGKLYEFSKTKTTMNDLKNESSQTQSALSDLKTLTLHIDADDPLTYLHENPKTILRLLKYTFRGFKPDDEARKAITNLNPRLINWDKTSLLYFKKSLAEILQPYFANRVGPQGREKLENCYKIIEDFKLLEKIFNIDPAVINPLNRLENWVEMYIKVKVPYQPKALSQPGGPAPKFHISAPVFFKPTSSKKPMAMPAKEKTPGPHTFGMYITKIKTKKQKGKNPRQEKPQQEKPQQETQQQQMNPNS